jgi:peptidoglycan/xylan/chitin deacetylase (PgdA/CDA1 family)
VASGRYGRGELALTFDAGSDARPVNQILRVLADEQLRCTFFLTGKWVSRFPSTARAIVDAGHEIGNHSWSHPAFTQLSDDEIRDELERTEKVIQETTGATSLPLFRPPLGDRDRRVLKTVADAGYQTIYWTLDSHDSVVKGITQAQIRDRVTRNLRAGSIVLMHCGSQPTADALPEIIAAARSRGLAPVTVGQLLTP